MILVVKLMLTEKKKKKEVNIELSAEYWQSSIGVNKIDMLAFNSL